MSADSFCSGVCSQRNEEENDDDGQPIELDIQELQAIKLSELRQRASVAPGVAIHAVEQTDDLEDAGDRRAALIDLLLAAPPGAGSRGKLFNDCVHEHYELPYLCVKVMDTPEFQRLRDLKQLGGTYNVFTCAAHNRFEHSLGTAHLAGKVAAQLSKLQPSLGISEKDILCCQLAGLCHDLGHGPMSHMFDGKFLTKMQQKMGDVYVPPHEELSTRMLDHLIEANDLDKEFKKIGLDETDKMFIKEMIDHRARGEAAPPGAKGDGEKPERAGEEWRMYGGRPTEKQFLYEIISNDVNGVDVDKFDYFMRDAKFLNIPITFDPKRLMANTRVARSSKDGKLHIAFQVKEAWNLYELFHTRYTLHKRAYQHKTANSIEEMLCEVMMLAEPHLRIYRGAQIDPSTCQPKVYTPYESLADMGAYAKLADSGQCVLHASFA
jgi:HD superfamily phosphohydrolase